MSTRTISVYLQDECPTAPDLQQPCPHESSKGGLAPPGVSAEAREVDRQEPVADRRNGLEAGQRPAEQRPTAPRDAEFTERGDPGDSADRGPLAGVEGPRHR